MSCVCLQMTLNYMSPVCLPSSPESSGSGLSCVLSSSGTKPGTQKVLSNSCRIDCRPLKAHSSPPPPPQDALLHLLLLTTALPLSLEDLVLWYDLGLFLPFPQTSVLSHLQLALILLPKMVLSVLEGRPCSCLVGMAPLP